MSILIQKFVMAVFPRELAGRIKAESQDWTLECPSCKHVVSLWDYGGIRYKATKKPALYGMCLGCRSYKWLRLYKKSSEPQAVQETTR